MTDGQLSGSPFRAKGHSLLIHGESHGEHERPKQVPGVD